MLVKLLQWNICNAEKTENIAQFLKEVNPDIALLQEFTWKNRERYKEYNKFDDIFKYKTSTIAQKLSWGKIQGNAIFSKMPLKVRTRKYIQSPCNYIDCSTEGRKYLECEISINNKPINIATTHLSYTTNYIATPLRDKEMKKLLNEIKKHNKKYIFAGDLNTPENSTYIKNIKQYLVHHKTPKNTWPSKTFKYKGFKPNLLTWKVDYIFSTKDINIKKVEVLETKYSDHLPILIQFEI